MSLVISFTLSDRINDIMFWIRFRQNVTHVWTRERLSTLSPKIVRYGPNPLPNALIKPACLEYNKTMSYDPGLWCSFYLFLLPLKSHLLVAGTSQKILVLLFGLKHFRRRFASLWCSQSIYYPNNSMWCELYSGGSLGWVLCRHL